jgi:hypothetical protein
MRTCTCPLDGAQPFGGEPEDVFEMATCPLISHKITGWVGSALYVILVVIVVTVGVIAVS